MSRMPYMNPRVFINQFLQRYKKSRRSPRLPLLQHNRRNQVWRGLSYPGITSSPKGPSSGPLFPEFLIGTALGKCKPGTNAGKVDKTALEMIERPILRQND